MAASHSRASKTFSCLPEMENVIKALQSTSARNSIKALVGGAPVTSKFVEKIGSDGYCENAAEAVELAKTLMETH